MSRNSFFTKILVLWLLVLHVTVHATDANKTPLAKGYGGAVATVNALASRSALDVLNDGGNAIDAAVAAAATLGVTDPFSCGIGGGGFMMIYLAKDKRVISIDHRETAPACASATIFTEHGDEMSFDKAKMSGLSVGVPGTVRGWYEALSRFGTKDFKHVLAPAIAIAEKGFVIDENFHRLNQENEKKFALFATSRELYLKNNKALPVGTHFKNPGMARAYREIAEHGVRYFYEDKPAIAMIASVQSPPTVKGVKVPKGTMTMADLANYEARLRLPIHSTYRGHDIYGMNVPSSGGVAIAEALNILEGYDLSSMTRAEVEHLYLETSRVVFADRNAYLADPEFVDVPLGGLLSKDYASQRRKDIDRASAKHGVVGAGDPHVFLPDYAGATLKSAVAQFAEESSHTTHFTVADRDGNIVAYTFTIEDWGGSGIVVPGYGFLLNNELTDFNFATPRANTPAPGKRPRSSMSPTFVLKHGKPIISLGSPGGSTIITTVLQTLVNYFDLGMPLADALAAPRMSQRNGATTLIEPGYKDTARAQELVTMGHRWSDDAREIGAANAIFFEPDGAVVAISEPKRHGVGSALVQSIKSIDTKTVKK